MIKQSFDLKNDNKMSPKITTNKTIKCSLKSSITQSTKHRHQTKTWNIAETCYNKMSTKPNHTCLHHLVTNKERLCAYGATTTMEK